jgi:hypothetical protein
MREGLSRNFTSSLWQRHPLSPRSNSTLVAAARSEKCGVNLCLAPCSFAGGGSAGGRLFGFGPLASHTSSEMSRFLLASPLAACLCMRGQKMLFSQRQSERTRQNLMHCSIHMTQGIKNELETWNEPPQPPPNKPTTLCQLILSRCELRSL